LHTSLRALWPALLVLSACDGVSATRGTPSSLPDGSSPGASPDGGTASTHDQARSTLALDPASGLAPAALGVAVAANNAFAVDLYSRIRAGASGRNLMTSPLSASVALTMAYAGARGTTATEMAAALHFDPSAASIFDGQNALLQALAARAPAALAQVTQVATQAGEPDAAPLPTSFVLDLVNSLWGQSSYPWAQPFLDRMARTYGAGVFLEDFAAGGDAPRVAINGWVAGQTGNTIQDLLPVGSLDASTRMVLVNATQLKMPWSLPFDPGATAPATFTRGDGTAVTTSFMHMEESFFYADDGQAQTVALNLGGDQLTVVFTLPHGDLTTYEAALTQGTIPAPQVPATHNWVNLSIPTANVTSPTLSLADALKAMGMRTAFQEGQADFSGLCASAPDGGQLYVGDIFQKAMFSMDEGGVEAAAATAVVISLFSGPGPSVPTVTLDRPFLASIVDQPTGAILFMGEIGDPSDHGGP
jgi:serpin B